jgi:arylsulfatase
MRFSRIVLVFLCLLSAGVSDGFAAGKPNILIILADDMGFSDLGCYGGEIATPNLDALANNGLRFTQFYNTARCWPSRGCLMTGYYAQQIRRDTLPGIPSGGNGVRPRWAPLVTEFLKTAGYRCYHSGKWHIDGKPLKNGFDHSYEIGHQDNNFRSGTNTEDGQPVPEPSGYYSATAFADHAIKCLREHAAKYPDRPFFEYLCFITPHFPLQAPAADITRYKDVYHKGWNAVAQARFERMTKMGLVQHALPEMEREVGPPYSFPDALLKLGPNEVNRPLPWSELTDAQRQFQAAKMAGHAAMVDRIDREVGRVLEQLEAMGASDNTLVLFASDNGASAEIMVRGDGHDPEAPPGSAKSYLCLGPGWSSAANTPLRRHKTWVHEGGISTPLIAHWPAGIKARGELRRNPAHFIDVAPTLLEIAGAGKPQTVGGQPVPAAPGKSLVSVFEKDNTVSHDFLWWLHEDNRAIRAGDMKLVSAKGPWELYDLATDRGESHNLAAKYPDKVRELSALWEKQTDAMRKLALTDLPPAAAGKKSRKPAQ